MRPLVILLHGTRFDARAWDGYADLLDADVRALDLPGHGVRAGQPWTTDAALAVIDDEVATVAPETPVVLVGHSLGGFVATAWAQRHPDALTGLVLVGAMADPSRHRILTRLYTDFARLLPVVGPQRMASVANTVLRAMGLPRNALPDATGYAVAPDAWGSVVTEAGCHQLTGVSSPVWLVAGALDQLAIDTRRYARACQDARVVVVRLATHLLPFTHRRQLADVIAEASGRGAPTA
ncbi:MAG: alpha/beta fold hydrolase [Propionibacteriaceae bacterium]|nr:alpha/beta fold hydrolase [Propionibacteriaceae bacterium]